MQPHHVAIIGSSSFSGTHCVEYVLKHTNCNIIGISRSPGRVPVSKRFQFFKLDINKDLKKIIRVLDKLRPDVIINFAAQGNSQFSWSNPSDWLMTNTLGICNLAFALNDKPYLKRYINVTTPEVYGPVKNFKENARYYNPGNPYAVSKAAADMFIMALHKQYGFPVIHTRSANIYGPHQQLYRIIPRAMILIKRGKKIPLHGGGTAIRSFVHIQDIMDGIYRAMTRGKVGEIYHFSARGQSIKKLVQLICKKMKVDFSTAVEVSTERKGQDEIYELNDAKSRRELGWKPSFSLERGIDDVLRWVDDSWEEIRPLSLEYIHKK